MKKIVFLAFVSVLLLMSMHGRELVMTASSSTAHHVYSGQSIQEAVNSAQSGDTIFVHAGTYYEQVVVNKSVLLIGEDDSSTIIDGNSTGNVICVTANNVKISGFIIQNSGLYDSGICLDYSSGNNISNNIITNNYFGIDLCYSSNNTLNGNNVTNNGYGICSANNHTIHGYGIGLFSCENNTIYHNNFIDNFIHNTSQVWNSVSTNFWNHGGEGNYWSDYEGVDRDGDGIGDSPYVIDEKNRDNHPLMSPWTPTWHPTPLWMRWWFCTIVAAGIAAAVLAGTIYFHKKRKPPTPTAPPPPEKTTTHLT